MILVPLKEIRHIWETYPFSLKYGSDNKHFLTGKINSNKACTVTEYVLLCKRNIFYINYMFNWTHGSHFICATSLGQVRVLSTWSMFLSYPDQCLLSRLKKQPVLFMCPCRTCFDSKIGPLSRVFVRAWEYMLTLSDPSRGSLSHSCL